MDPKISFAVDMGIASFLESPYCSDLLKKQLEQERLQNNLAEQHFHDLVNKTVLVATLSAFIAGLASNIASTYFEKKFLTEKEAEKIAIDTVYVKKNEIRLKFGPKAIDSLIITEEEVKIFSKHVCEACAKVSE